MNDTFSILRSRFYSLLSLILFIIIFPHVVNASECVYARDTGTVFTVIVPANPELTVDNKYSNEGVSQRAAWTDTKLYTSGDSFYFEIEGMWTPWSATFDMIGGDDKNSSSYTGLTTKPTNAFYCSLGTKNKDTDEIGYNGEFDYISSLMDVKGTLNSSGEEVYPYIDTMKPAYAQNTCWLTTGEGLYIGFFGTKGDKLPTLATHLKTADILCDEKYLLDKNNDGIITLNECNYSNRCYNGDTCTNNEKYENTNMAYYTVGAARCESEFYHATSGLPDGAIGINDCYQDVTYSSGTVREDKTLFIFDAGYLYKNIDLEKAGKNERIKFVIYDSYYTDNVGQYKIYMYSGVTDNSNKGLIEKILGDLETLFIGSRDENGVLSSGYLMTFYNYIVSDSGFAAVVRIALVVYMAFLGLSFALGSIEYTTKQLMNILLKLTFVIGFTTSTSWELYDRFVVRFFYDGFSSIISMLGNISMLISDDTATVTTGTSMASKFAFIDNMILSLFSDSVTKKIWGLFFGVWYGFIVIPIIYALIIYYIYQLINAVFPYIVMFIQAMLALFLGPIFIAFYLFQRTEFMFKAWLNFIGGRFASMMFLFLALFLFWAVIQEQFNTLLNFNSCKVPLLQAIFTNDSNNSSMISTAVSFFSLGISVWDANWNNIDSGTPSFVNFCLSLLFLYIIIYLFGIVMKKIPTITDSMFTIGGEKAGAGLNFKGESRFGTIGGFFENVDKSITVGTGEFKNGKEVRKGLFTYLGDKRREYVKEGTKTTGSALLKFGSNKTYKPIRDYMAGKMIKSEVEESGLKGKIAVDEATRKYEDSLQKLGFSKFDIEEKSAIFREEMANHFLANERQQTAAKLQSLSSSFDEMVGGKTVCTDHERCEIIKEQLDSYVRTNFDSNYDGSNGDYYSSSSKIILQGATQLNLSGESSINNMLSFTDLSQLKRGFSLKEKSKRYDDNITTFGDYQKHLDEQIRSLFGKKDPKWQFLAKEKYWTAIEESSRITAEASYNAKLINNPNELEKRKKEINDKLESSRKVIKRPDLTKDNKDKVQSYINYYITKLDKFDNEKTNLITSSIELEKDLSIAMNSAESTDKFVEDYNKANPKNIVVLHGTGNQLSGIPGLSNVDYNSLEKPLGFAKDLDTSVIESTNFTGNEGKDYMKLYEENRLKIEQQQLQMFKYKAALITDDQERAKFVKEVVEQKETSIKNRKARIK